MKLFLISAFIIVSLINSGAMLDQRNWVFHIEVLRMLIVLAIIMDAYPNGILLSMLVAAAIIVACYFRPIERGYLSLLYEDRRKSE